MAGRPKTRARREAKARRRNRFDRAAREAILKRADEVGSTAAAREASVAPGTLRTWRKRMADEPEPAPVALPGESTAETPASRAEALRRSAERAREASSRALDQADAMLARGLASESRNAAVVAGVHADRAQELEASARQEEAHELRLAEGRATQVVALVGKMFAAVDLSVPSEIARAALRGEEITPEVAAQAREQVHRAIAAEVRAQVLAELEAERLARPALPAGEDEGGGEPHTEVVDAEVIEDQSPAEVDDDGLPSWHSLPEEWKERFWGDREVGRSEWRNELVRQRSSDGASARGVSTWDLDQFRHPGLRGR